MRYYHYYCYVSHLVVEICIYLVFFSFLVQAVKELNDLYRIYEQEIQDLSSGRDTVLKHLNTNPYRPESVLGLRPLGSSESMWELNHMEPLNEETDDGQP